MSLIMQIMVGAVAFVIMVSIYFIITRDELFEGIMSACPHIHTVLYLNNYKRKEVITYAQN